MEDARKGALDIGRMFDSKDQCRKVKIFYFGKREIKDIMPIQEAKVNRIVMGEHSLENSMAEKCFGDQISIIETIDKLIIGLDKKIINIMAVEKNPFLMAMPIAMAASLSLNMK